MGSLKAAVAALAALVFPTGAWAAPLVVRATLEQSDVRFGETVTTHVLVLADRGAVRAGSVRIVEDPGPLTVLSARAATRNTGDDTVAVSADRVVACLDAACISQHGDATPKLPRVIVTATGTDGRTLHADAAWPELRVRGRVTTADLARARPPFRVDTQPAPASYRIDPTLLERLLTAAAAVLALAALALVARESLRRHRARVPPEDPLLRALRLTREAESRPPPDRRRAVGLLARVLAERERPLAEAARDLAWARPAPEPDAVERLAGDVEREVRS